MMRHHTRHKAAEELSYLNGRLAGLTNRKLSRVQPDGRSPYVLLHESGGGTAPRAGELLEAAAERLRRLERQTEALRADEARLLARVAGSHDAGRGGASLSPAPPDTVGELVFRVSAATPRCRQGGLRAV